MNLTGLSFLMVNVKKSHTLTVFTVLTKTLHCVFRQYDVWKNYAGSVYGGLRDRGLCVFRELCPVSIIAVGESPSVLL